MASGSSGDAPAFTLLRLLNVLLGYRRAFIYLPLLFAILAAIITLVIPARYTANASFVGQSGQNSVSQLTSLAAQFGINVPVPEATRSPQFYANLLRSRAVLQDAVTSRYGLGGGDSARGTLVDAFAVEGDTGPVRIQKAVRKLRERLQVTTDRETGIVQLSVTTGRPALSDGIVRRLLSLVNEFNNEQRQSQAAAERRFLAKRVASARMELTAIEDTLQGFLESNRSYENSPALRFQFDRLQRRVSLAQQVYTSLAQSFEQAKIDEVRDTPVITVIDPSEVPPRADSRLLFLKVVLGLLIGVILAFSWALGCEFIAAARREDSGQYARFLELKRQVSKELSRWKVPWRGGDARGEDG